MNLKKLMKRLCSGFMVFALVGTFVPTALAAPSEGVDMYSNHYVIMDGEISKNQLDKTALDKFTPADQDVIGNTSNETLDLWVSSDDMSGDDYQIPYVKDGFGNTWYLQQIVLYNFINDRDESQTLMNADAIAAATSKDDYTFSVSDITITNKYEWYDVCYGWTMTPPNQWGGGSGTQETYTVIYDFNIPTDVNSIFPITDYGIRGNESSGSYDYIKNKVDALTSTKLEDQNFIVADGLKKEGDSVWHGFFGYKWDDPDTSYYYFDGWTAEDGSEYKTGATATASSILAGNNTEIKFTGVWKEVPKWTEEQLAKAEQTVPLDVFTRGDNGDLLIAQSTDTLTKEDNLISYTVSAAVNHDLLLKSNVPFLGRQFATFEIIVNVDPNLEFANRNSDGTVTLNMESKLVVPKTITATNGDFTWTGDGKNWTVTFDPGRLPLGENGSQICIQAEFTEKDYAIVSDVMTLTGLDFRLKEDVFESTVGALQVNTSANMTAKMNLRNMAGPSFANNRYRLWVVEGLLGKNDATGEAWRTYFEGGVDDPTAYVHALQFLDYKLADYDLNADTTATLKANTVEADILYGTVTVTPADITIYMGGDGGYDAVVGESGTTTSNSLPHPLFKIEAPDGIDPEDLTFTNGDKTWTVVSDGNGYYHFSEGQGQDKVRVTYSYTDQSGKIHMVTNDNFDPTTVGDMYATLKIDLYPGGNDMSQVRAESDNGVHYVTSQSGTLTIRAVEDQDATSEIQDAAPTESVAVGSAVAVEPEGGTTYTLNNTGVRLPADSKPSLLFDSIIEDEESTARTDALEDKVDEKLGEVGSNTTRHYEIKYLDLVDANNGNAWITSSAGTDIYWGYPEGTDTNTTFKLVHFNGLHRDDIGGNSGFDVTDISNLDPENIEIIDVETTENGIKFHVDAGGFSPFALVWETTSGGGGGTTTRYTITAEAGDGGSISPSGRVSVTAGADRTFTITADDGYEIADVIVDDKSAGAVSSYTFEKVRANHTIEAIFEEESGVTDPDDTGVSGWLDTDDHAAYLEGYPNDLFGANDNMTRAEVAQMFYNLLLDKNVDITVTFDDVAADAWYADAVNTLASLGMIEGVGNNLFEPERSITRAEFTTIAMRFTKGTLEGENIFPDVNPDDWFYDYVVGSIQYGWIKGLPDGTFGPNNTITRAEVTTIVNRMLDRSADEDYVDSHTASLRQFTDLADTHWAYYDIMEATNTHDYTKDTDGETWADLG